VTSRSLPATSSARSTICRLISTGPSGLPISCRHPAFRDGPFLSISAIAAASRRCGTCAMLASTRSAKRFAVVHRRRASPRLRCNGVSPTWDVFLASTVVVSAKVPLKRCPVVPVRHCIRRTVRRRHFLISGRHGGSHGAPNESIASRSTIVRGSRYSPTDQFGPGRRAGKSGCRSSGARSGHRSIQNRSRR
jgi:hypothetical protein